MKKKTLVFTDLDGTLLDHYTYKTDDARATITSLNFHDIPIIANSSKTKPEIQLIQQQLGLSSPFIVENGAAVFIPLNYFPEQPENTQVIGDFWVKTFCEFKEHWLSLMKTHCQQFSDDYIGFSQMNTAQVAEATGLNLENAQMAKQRLFGEPVSWTGSDENKQKFINTLSGLGANLLQGGRFLHVSGASDKGLAQQWLADEYKKQGGFEQIQTIALGDGGNDVAMLEAATIAVQIRSPVHDFPPLNRTENVYQSNQHGPAGWAECLEQILELS